MNATQIDLLTSTWRLLFSGVSKTRGRGRLFFLKNAVLGLRLGLTLALTQTQKTHSLKKKIDPEPRLRPRFFL